MPETLIPTETDIEIDELTPIIERLQAHDPTAVLDFTAYFDADLQEMARWQLKKAPKHLRQNEDEDAYSEGLAAVLRVANEIQDGAQPWEDSPEKYVKNEIYWAIHDYLGGEVMKSPGNHARARWSTASRRDGYPTPDFVAVNESDRVADNDDLELIDAWDLIESCCHTEVELAIVKGCVTKTLRQVAEELGMPEQTASDRRKAVYTRLLAKKEALSCDD